MKWIEIVTIAIAAIPGNLFSSTDDELQVFGAHRQSFEFESKLFFAVDLTTATPWHSYWHGATNDTVWTRAAFAFYLAAFGIWKVAANNIFDTFKTDGFFCLKFYI